jgi:hypothetical protein
MARFAKQIPERQSDLISTSVLAKTYPLKQVRISVARTGKMSKRDRQLPSHVVVYFSIFLALFSGPAVETVFRTLLQGLRFIFGPRFAPDVPAKSALSKARQRLGWEPLAHLFDSVCKPMATTQTRGAFYKKWRLIAIDASTLDTPDTNENTKAFGKPKNGNGRGALPQLRFTALVEIGTHAIFAAAMDGIKGLGELDLARQLLKYFRKGYLVIADRYYPTFEFLKESRETGADLLYRIKKDIRLDIDKRLPDGSYLSRLHGSADSKKRASGVVVRVIPFKVIGIPHPEPFRLITTILDHKAAPADDLAALYIERWEAEMVFDELKNHLKAPAIPLRAKVESLVRQEFWSYLLAHYATRGIMHEAALKADLDPDEISFTHTIEIVKEFLPMFGAFSPGGNL